MLTTWLVPLTLLSGVSFRNQSQLKTQPQINGSHESSKAVFSIDEVLLLNRHFIDYLLAIDGPQSADETPDSLCSLAMRQLAEAYLDHQPHALEWFDSWGKLPTGLYRQNGYALGNVDQCRAIERVRMQHCTFVEAFPSELEPLVFGLCVPQHCRPDFVKQLYWDFLVTKSVRLMSTVEQEVLCIRDEEIRYDAAMVTAIAISVIIGVCVMSSTSYEVITEILQRKPKPLYTSFSLIGNLRNILQVVPRVNQAYYKSGVIDCLHGIRPLSMIWIVVLHVNYYLNLVPWENDHARSEYLQGFMFAVMQFSGSLAVDTFLTLGGMLAAMSMLRALDKTGKINPFALFLQRYIRITAPQAAVILFVVSFAGYMGEGVFWKLNVAIIKEPCMKNWWAALLHVQNYVDPENMCLVWTWYLSVDMQLYLITPALIYPLWRYGKRVLIAITGLALLSITCVMTTFLIYQFRLSFFAPGDIVRRYNLTYYATHARMAVWLWGLAFGYLLHRTKDTGVSFPKRFWIAGWITCLVTIGTVIFINFQIHTMTVDSSVIDAFYEPLSRSAFSFCVLWIILACVNGRGWLVDEFLGATVWQPLSRLSFCMYLLHLLLLVMASVASGKSTSHFSATDLFYRIWGAIGLTTSVALLWSAVFEVPFVTLSKLALRG